MRTDGGAWGRHSLSMREWQIKERKGDEEARKQRKRDESRHRGREGDEEDGRESGGGGGALKQGGEVCGPNRGPFTKRALCF